MLRPGSVNGNAFVADMWLPGPQQQIQLVPPDFVNGNAAADTW